MHRFYQPFINSKTQTVQIRDPEEIHHMLDVLRCNNGETVCLFNGQGIEAQGTIQNISKDFVEIHIHHHSIMPYKNIQMCLACAIPKKAKFEFIIEKATELGVDEIFPLITQRTEFKTSQERSKNKWHRYEKIAINASKQSQRATIPCIHPVILFSDFLAQIAAVEGQLNLIPCLLGERIPLQDIFKQKNCETIRRVTFLIGPEGDFTPREVQQAIQVGCQPISLGAQVLKVDTAAIVVCALTTIFFARNPNEL